MKKLAAVTLSLFLMGGTAFADSPKDTPKEAEAKPAKAAVKTNAQIAKEVEELRQSLQAQQQQLQMLKEELARRDQQIEEARKAAADADARAAAANAKAADAIAGTSEAKSGTAALSTTVSDLKASTDTLKTEVTAQAAEAKKAMEHGPTTIRFKGVNITPGGFLAGETVFRQHAESADINSNFNGTPYSANSTGKLTENNFSGRQSRLWLMFDSKVGDAKLTGYYEADFLGAGTTSNNRQSNSYVFRQRQAWARAELANGFAFSAGQMWSLATENRKGIANRAEWNPMQIDAQYVVGYTWARAYAARATKSFGDKLTVAFSAEGPQATLTAHGTSTYTSTAGAATTNAFVFSPGAGAGLYNAFDTTGYSINKLPDFVIKAAVDPGWGHYEVFGIFSEFRNRVYPCAVVSIPANVTSTATLVVDGNTFTSVPYLSSILTGAGALVNPNCTNTTPSVIGARNDSRAGGAGGFHFHAPFYQKKVDIGLTSMYGVGTGRFGSAQLPDATLRPSGTLAPIHNGHWLGSLEYHVNPKLDIYAYVGGEYDGRAAYKGFLSVTGSTATIPVTFSGMDLPSGTQVTFPYPETQTTWKTSTTGIGGYGFPGATDTGCSTEAAPGGTGAPSGGAGTCNGDTRYIGEATLGFWHKMYQGEKGRMQWGLQYSYLYKTGWSGSGGPPPLNVPTIAPHAVNNMFFTSFRYYLP